MTSTPALTQPLSAAPLALTCHPATPCPLDLRLSVALVVAGSETGAGWLLHYRITGDTAGLLLPPPSAPGPADDLWQHTCFEAFVACDGEPAYREFNFSPSGQWAAYRFSAERVRDPSAEAAAPAWAPELEFLEQPQSLDLQVWLPREALPDASAGASLILGLSAVLETLDGQLSYWALHHPAERPDFHHRAGLVHKPDLPPFPTAPAPLNPA
ncbi:MAG: DOMON-like domain-containing protein [Rhodoferax sp.]|uniref:DOMON-like domain-containing protein n=1 Tax=Rhodoferax sp. TaxID=50421 RepID=UPI002721A2DD|nr:DOMON-like domain-containing protein [Rhodoferax sp.]MDO9253331.1 DOMON-like domain-containing protein [Hydrogenophaga sp.]MDP3336321.1 DOMON-like domain-containing protein [Rhodoferax sp.]